MEAAVQPDTVILVGSIEKRIVRQFRPAFYQIREIAVFPVGGILSFELHAAFCFRETVHVLFQHLGTTEQICILCDSGHAGRLYLIRSHRLVQPVKELEQFFAREAAIGSDTHVGFGGFISRIELVIQKLRSAMHKVLEEVVLPAFRIRRIHVDTSGFLRYSGNILFQHFRAFLHLPEFFLTGLAARIGKQFPHHSVCAMTTHTRQFVAEAGCRA